MANKFATDVSHLRVVNVLIYLCNVSPSGSPKGTWSAKYFNGSENSHKTEALPNEIYSQKYCF
jgi:hypothetical protein